jgi:hypothetical protein
VFDRLDLEGGGHTLYAWRASAGDDSSESKKQGSYHAQVAAIVFTQQQAERVMTPLKQQVV